MNSIKRTGPPFLAILICAFAYLPTNVAWGRQEKLLNIGEGQLPTDTGSDKTTFSIENSTGLGGPSLRVAFASGDSFGDRISKVKDWTPFTTLEFIAYNPAPQDTRLVLTVKHKQTTGYPTRVDVPVTLVPGKNQVRVPISTIKNTNGSTPDLANVVRWYIASEDGHAPTIDFGNIRLLGEDVPDSASASTANQAEPPVAYRVKG